MPAILSPTNIADQAVSTYAEVARNKWTDITATYPKYHAARIFGMKELHDSSAGSDSYGWDVQVDNDNNFGESGLFTPFEVSIKNLLKRATVRYAMQRTGWGYDTNEETFNQGTSRILNYIKVREHSMFTKMWEELEVRLFSLPNAPSDLNGFWPTLGFPFWIVKGSASEVSAQGGNPSGWSAGRGGLSSSIYTKYKNVAGLYAQVSQTDLIRKIKDADHLCDWEAPDSFNELVGPGSMNKRFRYAGRLINRQLEEYLENSNDHVSVFDITKFQNKVIVAGAPLQQVDVLDTLDGTDKPIYSVDLNSFRIPLPGKKMQTSWGPQIPQDPASGPMARINGIDLIYQLVCPDIRRNHVLSYSSSATPN